MIPAMQILALFIIVIMVILCVIGVIIIPWFAVTGRFDKELYIRN